MLNTKRLATAGIAISCLLLLISASSAGVIVKTVEFPRPEVTCEGSTCLVSVGGLPLIGNAGEPLLPAEALKVLLPQGEEVVSVRLTARREEAISLESPIEWAQPPVPLSRMGGQAHVAADEAIYLGASPFPGSPVRHVTTETYRGYNIAFLRVYPVTYVGSENRLTYHPWMEITIETAPSTRLMQRSLQGLRPEVAGDTEAVRRMVRDVSNMSSYRTRMPMSRLGGWADPGETYPYVIITHADFESTFVALRDFRESRGFRAKIVRIGTIDVQYSGADLQEKIRNFIKDAYQSWETEYVLLAGDKSSIPPRGLYAEVPPYTDSDIASDLYFAALDGNWNDDGDGYWGEPDEADLIPEVSIGRVSVDNVTEAENWLNKVFKYESSPVTGQIKTNQLVGELLWDDPTWGGDYMDEIKNGSSAHGYTTAGFPGTFSQPTLYDRDLDPDRWDKEDLIPLMNGGRHIINHLGHSDVTYGLRMYNSDVNTRFTNDGVTNSYFMIYTQGCYSGSFDNRNGGGGYGDDCLGERFTLIANGAVAFIGNTRYGWGAHSSTRGANQYYHRQYWDAVFDEGLTTLGKANDDSKVDNIAYVDVGALRWVYYELVLLGDPAMDIWTDTPGSLVIDRPGVLYVSDNEVAISITDGTSPVEGARVAIYSDDSYSCDFTDASGMVYMDPQATAPGSLYVAVTAHNFYAAQDTVPVMDATHAVVIIDDYTVDDGTLGGGLGNGNGKAEAGETVESTISLRNVGQDTAFSVTAELECSDSYLTVQDSSGSYGDILPGAVVTPPWSYSYYLDPDTPDSHEVTLDLDIAHSDTTLTKHINVLVSAPVLELTGLASSDTLYGNQDACIEAGETFELSLSLTNRGSGAGEGVDVFLTENDPYLTIDMDSSHAVLIGPGQEVELSPAFVLTLAPDCPEFHQVDLGLTVEFASGRTGSDSTSIYVGGSLEDDCEDGEGGWVHYVGLDGYYDEWHLETNRNHTGGGTTSWKFGGSGSGNYTNYGCGALETPELCLGPNATLTMWHWIHAELNSGTYAWDGAIVEISVDGGETWSQVSPVGGYPYKIYSNSASPFAPDTPCFAWTDDWTQVEFDLSAYEGRASIRFVFGSDGYVTDEGWYLDDIVITDDYARIVVDGDGADVLPARFALHRVAPNPASSKGTISFDVPRTSHVRIDVFDVTGRVVTTVANSIYEPGRYSSEVTVGDGIASGVYFVRMNSQAFSETQKMIVLR
jgi:hypothetical protein